MGNINIHQIIDEYLKMTQDEDSFVFSKKALPTLIKNLIKYYNKINDTFYSTWDESGVKEVPEKEEQPEPDNYPNMPEKHKKWWKWW